MEKSMDQYDEDRTHNQEESKMRFNHNGRPTAVDADRFMSHDTETQHLDDLDETIWYLL